MDSAAPAGPPIDAGLSADEVQRRVAEGRTNAFTAATSRSWWSIIRANVFTMFNAIVFACFAVLLLLGRWQDALFGLAALFNALIGGYQEIRAKRALDKLALLNAPIARVRRDGAEAEIPPAAVVLDDILALRAGDQIPADAVTLHAQGLQVDESMLTGESDPVDKHPGDGLLSGSIVVSGRGSAVVQKVGADSYVNQFAGEAKKFSMMRSELKDSINRVLKWVGWGIGPIALLVTNAQVQVQGGWQKAISDGSWNQAAVDSIAVIVAMIPLGLVLLTSIAFAVGAARLAASMVLVQELPAVEGLARVDVVCLDKTGTLTLGDIAFDGAHPLDDRRAPGWRDALAWFGAAPDANATARSLGGGFAVSTPHSPERQIAFSSRRKWSAVSFAGSLDGTWVLGAPTMIFPDAGARSVPWGGPCAVNGKASLGDAVAELASTGRRTLLIAHSPRELDDSAVTDESFPDGLEPVAMVTLSERLRSDAAQTLRYFADQGVDVKIISGDDPHTVAAIARELGLDVPEGFDARALPADAVALGEVLEREHVFGRVTPEQKKDMVIALQTRGHVIAMTGDGVNDALAIKQADIGIAMNSGSAATKAVARLVLLDGQFSHLPTVVAEGRRVIANIERVSVLFLTKTAYATGIAILFGLMIMQIPFLPRQLSITDGLTIGIPAFFLALLPNTQRYLPGFLRRSLSFAIPAGSVVALAITAYSLIAGGRWGIPIEEIRTGSTILVGILGLWVLTLISLPLTWIKTAIIAAMAAGLYLAMTVPLAVQFFELVMPRPVAMALLVWLAGAGVILIGIARILQQSFLRRTPPPPSAPMSG
ncbi:HAD-IC family P-type ATPase [Microbacterium deminutum]|uniref:HAD-IC family P-type ATPase n=1 Tax=Microbacterium deminutum TaxID=344164 RepID=A0ABP5C7W7_9MICO